MADSNGASAWFSDAVAYPGVDIRRDMSALLMNTTSRAFGGRSGRRPGAGGVPTVSGTTITVPTGACQVDSAAPSSSASFLVSWAAAQTLAQAPADASNPRRDIVYVRVDEIVGSPTTQTITFGYQAGNAAASPVAPTALSDGTAVAKVCILGYLNVPKAGGGATTVTPGPVMVAAGGILPVTSQAERDALTAYEGMYIHRTDSGELQKYNGGKWELGVGATQEWLRNNGQFTDPDDDTYMLPGPTDVASGSWTSAPAGNYLIGCDVVISGGQGLAGGHLSLNAGGKDLTRGCRCDATSQPGPVAYVRPLLGFAGGTLTVAARIVPAVGTYYVHDVGTGVWATFLG